MRKTFMKRSIVIFMALIMAVSVAGCGKKDNTKEKQKMTEEEKNAIYTYESMGFDEETANNLSSIQICGDKMYSIYYDYNEETYESTQYFITFDTNGKELSRFVVPNTYEETEGGNGGKSHGYNNLTVSENGEIFCIEYNYNNYEDKNTGDWIWEENYSLARLDEDGNVIWSREVGNSGTEEINNGGDYYSINSVSCDKNNQVWVFASDLYTCFDKDGNQKLSCEALENTSGDVWTTKDGNFIVGQWDDDWSTLSFYQLDTKTGKMGSEKMEIPGSYYQFNFYSGENSSYDMLATNSVGVWGFNWGDTDMTKVMDYILSDFDGSYVYNIKALSETQFIGSYYDADWNYQVASFAKVPADEVVDRYIMTMACYYTSNELRKHVVEFNRSHEEVRITLNDYSMYNSEEDYEAGINRLNSDILAGNVPDILVVPSSMDMGNYINKGLFADLYEFIEKDKDIDLEDYLSNIIALGEYDGKLYEMITQFSTITLVGKTSDVGEGYQWTYDDVNALVEKKGDAANLFPTDTSRSSVMYYGLNMGFDQFYNSNTGECRFDTQEFQQYLELLNKYPEEISDEMWDDESYWTDYETQWRDGRTLLAYRWISDFNTYSQLSQGLFGDKVSYIGFPTTQGGGSAASVDYTLAMSAESAFQDEAWEYISYFLKDEYQDEITEFPVKLSSLDKKAEKERTPDKWINEETGEEEEDKFLYWLGNEQIELQYPTNEECEYVVNYLKSIDYRMRDMDDITAIIEEDAAAYFAGEKTANQVADTIQSRVKILVNEKR